jgi:hypothetical protein
MIATRRAANAAWISLAVLLVLVAAVAVQAQTAEKPTVTTNVLSGEVVKVEGSSLVVKLTTGETKTFKVPADRKFEIDGKEVGVGDLQPGTTLTATVKTTTTPVSVRTRKSVSGKVWYAAPPTVILTLPSGENKQYTVRDEDKVEFTLDGKLATVFDLRPGMNVTAVKIVEVPDVEITTDTKVVGQAPKPAAPAPTETPAAPAAAAPTPSSETQPVAPEAASSTSTLVWVGLVVVLIVIAIFLFRKFSGK